MLSGQFENRWLQQVLLTLCSAQISAETVDEKITQERYPRPAGEQP
jgi:hypothetical protein